MKIEVENRKFFDYKVNAFEKIFIRELFLLHIESNSGYENLSQPEFEHFYMLFERGWIARSVLENEMK